MIAEKFLTSLYFNLSLLQKIASAKQLPADPQLSKLALSQGHSGTLVKTLKGLL